MLVPLTSLQTVGKCAPSIDLCNIALFLAISGYRWTVRLSRLRYGTQLGKKGTVLSPVHIIVELLVLCWSTTLQSKVKLVLSRFCGEDLMTKSRSILISLVLFHDHLLAMGSSTLDCPFGLSDSY